MDPEEQPADSLSTGEEAVEERPPLQFESLPSDGPSDEEFSIDYDESNHEDDVEQWPFADDDKQHDDETRRLLGELRESMRTDHMGDFVFACGGSLPIDINIEPGASSKQAATTTTEEPSTQPESRERRESSGSTSASTTSTTSLLTISSCKPVTLRWDPSDAATPASRCKLVLPLEPSTSDNLAHLASDMAPATFGIGGKDVFDESYRKALKLDPSQFSVDFCPYECGIVDAISQVLLPSLHADVYNLKGIRAELYKLNIYEGPSGHFRAHVDTPLSATHFGSLVVCLPLAHEGGALEVRHGGKTTAFDWSQPKESKPAIQWAAFYSDCEHEVLQVQSGNRVTLTYNLYAVFGNGHIVGHCKSLDSAQSPLYKHMRAIIDNENFMPKGGYLGYYTIHAYPHSSESSCLPETLKGLDMAMWEVFQALGCGVCLRPIVVHPDDSDILGRRRTYILEDFDIRAIDNYAESQEDLDEMLGTKYGQEKVDYSRVAWLNQSSGHQEFQIGYTVYGNEPCSMAAYSACAIIVGVPPYEKGVGRRILEITYDSLLGRGEKWTEFEKRHL